MIPNWLLQRAYLTPHKIALSYQDKQWTFFQLKVEAMKYAGKLVGSGIKEGSRIALIGPSTSEMVFIIHGCLLANLEIVMLNNRLSTRELVYQIEDSEAEVVISADEFSEQFKEIPTHCLSFSELIAQKQVEIEVVHEWTDHKTITIMYTSGTTGYPKGVRQTARNHTSSALSSVLNLGLSDEDVWLCTMPLFHISGFSILVRSVLYGMEVQLHDKFCVQTVVDEIRRGTITTISVVTATLQQIIAELEQSDTMAHPRFKTMLAGGGSVPQDYIERAAQRNLPVLQTYGMTETSSQTATLSSEDGLRKIGSAGKPLFFNQIKIKEAIDYGVHGEIMVKGPHVTPGYVGKFQDTNPVEDGWLSTGDIGYFDEEGYLFVVDRRSDLIISGGENVYPAEIENVLMAHRKIKEAGVCGMEDEKWGTVPVAFIVVNHPLNETEIRTFCEERLARYKIPKAFYFVEQLPRNASNKLLRRELKQWLK